jgi:hypothetical protein
MVRLGDLADRQGHTSKAIGFWTTARPLFERSLQVKDVAQIDVRLSTAHQKSLLLPTTLGAPDQVLHSRTSEIDEVETVCLDASPEDVFPTSETTLS